MLKIKQNLDLKKMAYNYLQKNKQREWKLLDKHA